MDGVAVVEQIAVSCFRSFMRIRNAELLDDGRIFGVMSHVPITFFNGIAMTNITEAHVVSVIDIFRAKGCPFRWWLTPSTRPAGLAGLLAANGMRHAYDAPGMAADLTSLDLEVPPPAGVTIRQVIDLTPWTDVLAPTFSFPAGHAELWRDAYAQCGDEWSHFVAFLGDQPVATTSLLLDGTLAGIYMVGTLAHARGRGIGAAVTREAMRFARDRGATQAALQSSELGYGVYRGLGFVEYCNLRLYDWRPE
ncbi:MAG: GNAT family N-acetyltransferase [Thermoanaerobaculia bacterium]